MVPKSFINFYMILLLTNSLAKNILNAVIIIFFCSVSCCERTHTHSRTYVHTPHTPAHTYMCIHTHTLAHVHMHVHTRGHAHHCAHRARERTHGCMHTYLHSHTHTCVHTHTFKPHARVCVHTYVYGNEIQ